MRHVSAEDANLSFRWFAEPEQMTQHGALARTTATHDPQYLTSVDNQIDAFEDLPMTIMGHEVFHLDYHFARVFLSHVCSNLASSLRPDRWRSARSPSCGLGTLYRGVPIAAPAMRNH